MGNTYALTSACALAAALLFAITNMIQQRAASSVPTETTGPLRLMTRLLRNPRWLAGGAIAMVALGLHTLALSRGSVILVQTLLASGLVFALVIDAARQRRRLRVGEAVGAVVLVSGVSLLLGVGHPVAGRGVGLASSTSAAICLVVVGGAGLLASRVRGRDRLTGRFMGAAAGTCFALDAVFLKAVAGSVSDLDTLTTLLNLAGFLLASVTGNILLQRAYQRAELSTVLPTVTAGDPVAAFILGRAILHESLHGGLLATTGAGVGLVAIVIGITLDTSWGGRLLSREWRRPEWARPAWRRPEWRRPGQAPAAAARLGTAGEPGR